MVCLAYNIDKTGAKDDITADGMHSVKPECESVSWDERTVNVTAYFHILDTIQKTTSVNLQYLHP